MSPKTVSAADYPSMSVLVTSYNQEQFIGDTVDSVLNQRYSGPLEIIFCDDCSTDNTFAVIKEKVERYRGPFRIVTYRCPQNGRVAVNMNTAVSLSSGDWLLRADGDDVQHPDRCALTAETIRRHPNAAAVTGQLQMFRSGEALVPVINPPPGELLFQSVSLRDFASKTTSPSFEWWGGMMALSRQIFDVFGPLPSACAVLDDTMFVTRALMLGEFVTVQNGTFVYYRRHAGNISSERNQGGSLPTILRGERSAVSYYRKGLPCHEPILAELASFAAEHPEAEGLAAYFTNHFEELRTAASRWDANCIARCRDAWKLHPDWPLLSRLSLAFSLLNPFCHALHTWLHQRKTS